jgi:hypothetical protein
MIAQSCGACRFCFQLATEPDKGVCRQRPPHAFREEVGGTTKTLHVHAHMPFVFLADLGCGQFKPKLGLLGRAVVRLVRLMVSL